MGRWKVDKFSALVKPYDRDLTSSSNTFPSRQNLSVSFGSSSASPGQVWSHTWSNRHAEAVLHGWPVLVYEGALWYITVLQASETEFILSNLFFDTSLYFSNSTREKVNGPIVIKSLPLALWTPRCTDWTTRLGKPYVDRPGRGWECRVWCRGSWFWWTPVPLDPSLPPSYQWHLSPQGPGNQGTVESER